MVYHFNYWVGDVGVFCVQLASVTSHSDMFKSVVEALSEIAPAERYLQTNVVVPSGHIIGEHLMQLFVSQHFAILLRYVLCWCAVKKLLTRLLLIIRDGPFC